MQGIVIDVGAYVRVRVCLRAYGRFGLVVNGVRAFLDSFLCTMRSCMHVCMEYELEIDDIAASYHPALVKTLLSVGKEAREQEYSLFMKAALF